jgi:hypothetical protein
VLSGTGCNVVCTTERKRTSTSGDGCCLNGPSADDTDCEAPDPMCGNKMVEEPAEDCDGDCPECVAPNICTESRRATPCRKACEETPIGPSGSRTDGCCPNGADNTQDTDCPPRCGNGVKENGETCDPCETCVDTDPCTREVETGTMCNLHCEHERLTPSRVSDTCCPSGGNANNDADCRPECGNGEKEADEECDEVSTTCSLNCKTITTPAN